MHLSIFNFSVSFTREVIMNMGKALKLSVLLLRDGGRGEERHLDSYDSFLIISAYLSGYKLGGGGGDD
jgi:hypothetical protein